MNKLNIIIAAASMALVSCNDFLEREPLDFGNKDSYYRTAEDLKIAVNDFYQVLPVNNRLLGGIYSEDTNSDNQCSGTPSTVLYRGNKRTVMMDDADNEWNFEMLRGINDFINTSEEKMEHITGNEALKNHYLGEGYFFRAYEYYRLLKNFGDAPILTEVLSDDLATLIEKSKRQPRNQVARFIIEDLDKAASLLQVNAPESGRITKAAAYALKSRVALYEGTWEKYHANTCFVPGNQKWPGAAYNTDFAWPLGSAEAEYKYFFQEAYKAADLALEGRTVLETDYPSMFVNFTSTFGDSHEVILARYYLSGVLSHSASAFLKSGGNNGVTRAAVNSYLMTSGLPIYADANYQGDTESYYELKNRDLRLTTSVRACGKDIVNVSTDPITGDITGDTIYYYLPYITESANAKCITGYELNKWCSTDPEQQTQYYTTTAVPLIRTGEVMVNYLEAYYEANGNLGGNCDTYWRALRSRAGVDTDYNKTIANTDLAKENDLAIWSRGNLIDETLYNIRRERRCELIAEGFRLDDLKRWRALDMCNAAGMVTDSDATGYQPEGFNLWEKVYEYYEEAKKTLGAGTVSQQSVSNYLRPLQTSTNSNAYNGYDFPKPHYLEPIPISEFSLTTVNGSSTMYQNPGWPQNADGIADYSYDCD